MVHEDDIAWGSYGAFKGPFYRGKIRFDFSAPKTLYEKTLAVTTATEAGAYDATNMYDGQIYSGTLIQLIERGQRSMSALLGEIPPEHREPLNAHLKEIGASFVQEGSKWFFYFKGERVDTLAEQRTLFHLFSTGEKGTWDPVSRTWAKKWAAALASVWEDEEARRVQRAHIAKILDLFLYGRAKGLVNRAREVGTDEAHALVAMVISFAVNNPVRAAHHVGIAEDLYKGTPWTKDFLIHCARELTFGPKISIYPHRWDAIRPKLEQYFNLDLPDFSDELKAWRRDTRHDVLFDTKEVQEALISLGYDLGSAGADGKYGQKTRAAVRSFEVTHEVPHPDGMMDPLTARRLTGVLYARGLEHLLRTPKS